MPKTKRKAEDPWGPAPTFSKYQPPKKKFSMRKGNEVTNFYDILSKEKEYKTKKVEYSNQDSIQIDVPFMMSISGKTGSGKTNVALDIIKNINCFDKIFLCVKDDEEPLYRWLTNKIRDVEKKTGAQILTVITEIEKIPYVADLNREVNNLFIFDDLISEKDKLLKKVEEYYIRGRKMNASCMFLSQSYYSIPKVIRKNCFYIILKHIAQATDLKRILVDYSQLDISFRKLNELYHEAIDGSQFNFFMIDLVTKDDDKKFRINYEGIPASEWKNESQNSKRQTNKNEEKESRIENSYENQPSVWSTIQQKAQRSI